MTTVFIVSAPSGSGKSTLVARLLADVPNLAFSVSSTTRAPRGHEVPEASYHFVSEAEFREGIERGEFLEYARVFGHYYGTHRRVLEAAQARGQDLVLDIDVQGAAQLRRKLADAVSIFILAPSREILEQRLRSRSEDSDAVIARRLEAAAEEIRDYRQYDYVLVNRELEESADTLAAIVKAERVRRARMEEQLGPILETFE